MVNTRFVMFAALNAAIAIAAGAFAAHGLGGDPNAPRVSWLKTGAEYQLIHSVALLALAALGGQRFVSICFAIGIVLFSGSLYLMAFTMLQTVGVITPIGGLAFIIGWLALAWTCYPRKP